MRITILLTCLMFAVCFGQQKQKYSIAVLPSINADYSEEKKLTARELDFLTEKVREIATKVLPVNQFTLLKQNAVVERIGEEEYFKACKEGSCVGDLAKKISVDYAARCDVSNINDRFVLKFELYSVKGDATLGIFSDYANDIDDMRRMIEEKTPAEFKKILSSNSGRTQEHGNNYGFLEIKPAFSDSIGKNKRWNLSINGNEYPNFGNKLYQGIYDVKLIHECYENISFKAGINKGSNKVFDMSEYLNLKQGVLILNAEKNGEPVSEPVFANGKRIGETPFNSTVPVCAEISIGNSKNKLDIKVLHNQIVKHKYLSSRKAKIEDEEEQENPEKNIFSIGFRAGLNSSHIYESYKGNSGTSDSKTGFHIGYALDVALSDWFYLQPGIMYIQKGAIYRNYNEIFHYIETPILASLKFSALRLNAGPYISFGIKGDDDNDREVIDFGFSYGFGFDIGKFYIGMFYDYGSKNITYKYNDLETYNRTLGFTLGYNP